MISAPLSSSMAIAGDETEQEVHIGQEGKQKSISQRSDQQEFEASFPSP